MTDLVAGLVVLPAQCCRTWLVLALSPVGRCALCGRHPIVFKEPTK